MANTAERMHEIARRVVASLEGTDTDPGFRDLWANEVTYWTCHGDDMDWTGTGAADSIRLSGAIKTDDGSPHVDEVRVRVAEDNVVVQMVYRVADPANPAQDVVCPQCLILDVEDGKIVRMNTYRDMTSHAAWMSAMMSHSGWDKFLGEWGQMVLRVRSLSPDTPGGSVAPEHLVEAD